VVRNAGDGRYRCSYLRTNGTGVASILPASPVPAIGDQVELLWRLYADGSVQIEQSINGGTPVVAARSDAIGLPTEWSGQILRLSGSPWGSNEARAAWRDAIVLRGAGWTMDELRRLVACGRYRRGCRISSVAASTPSMHGSGSRTRTDRSWSSATATRTRAPGSSLSSTARTWTSRCPTPWCDSGGQSRICLSRLSWRTRRSTATARAPTRRASTLRAES